MKKAVVTKFGVLNTLHEELSDLFVDTGGWLHLVSRNSYQAIHRSLQQRS